MNRKWFFLILSLWLTCSLSYSWASLNDGLIGHWPLNGDALDHSGHGHHGTMLTGSSFVQNPTGNSLVLQNVAGDVNTGYVHVGLSASSHPGYRAVGYKGAGSFWVMFDGREPMSVGVNVQATLGHPPDMLYLDRVMANNYYRTMVQRIERTGTNKNYWPTTATNSISQGNVWYHMAWTFHSHYEELEGYLRFYVNGILSSEYASSVQTNNTSSFRIGGGQDGYASNTKIAEVRLYDRILTPEEVLELSRQAGFHPGGYYPLWWELYNVINPAVPPDDFAVVNQGQLKHVATQAADYLDDALAVIGGAGPQVRSMITAWENPTPETDDYAAINLGQLKFVTAKLYDRLNEISFEQWPDAMMIDPVTGYPWAQADGNRDD